MELEKKHGAVLGAAYATELSADTRRTCLSSAGEGELKIPSTG